MNLRKENVITTPPLTRQRVLEQARLVATTTHEVERNIDFILHERATNPSNVVTRNVSALNDELFQIREHANTRNVSALNDELFQTRNNTNTRNVPAQRSELISRTDELNVTPSSRGRHTTPSNPRSRHESAPNEPNDFFEPAQRDRLESSVSEPTTPFRSDYVPSDAVSKSPNVVNQTSNEMPGNEQPEGPGSGATTTISMQDLQQTIVAAIQATLAAQANQQASQTATNSQTTPSHHHYGEAAKLIPIFDPIVYPHQTVEQWLKKVDEVAAIYKWPELAIIHHAMSQLQGTARVWYDGLPTLRHTWAEWKVELKEWFPAPRGSQRLYKEMEQRTRQRDEPIELYYHDKVSKARACGLSDEALIEYVITGLNDDRLLTALSTREFTSPPELLRFMKQLEERLCTSREARDKARNSRDQTTTKTNHVEKHGNGKKGFQQNNETRESKNKNKPKVNAAGDLLCFNCSKYGHISRECPLPPKRARCTHCQRTTHESKDCPTKSQGSTKQILTTETQLASPTLNEKYFKEATLNGIKVRSFIDLGSRCVTLIESVANEMHLVLEPPPQGCVIGGYGAGKTIPIGRINAEIMVDSATATTEIYIVPDRAQTIPLLIGQPFTEQSHVTVVRRNNTLRLFNETHDEEDECLKKIEIPELLPQRVNLWAQSATIIPSNYVGFVDIYTRDSLNSSDLFIEAQLRPQPGQEHCIPRSIVTLNEEGHCKIPVANVSDHELIIKANQKVTKAEICQPTAETNESQPAILATEISTLSHIPIEAIHAGPSVQDDQLKELHLLINEFRDCFAESPSELGRTDKAKMTIELTTEQPVTFRPYRLSQSERERVRMKLDELKKAGIVVDSTSPYASPILVVKKKSGEERICVDYRALNRLTKRDIFPLPLIDDQLERLQGNKLFTSLDLASGYYQIPMDSESQPKTAFVTPDGHYEFTSLPFGLTNGPAVFQRMIHAVLGPLRYSIALAYMDDVLIPSISIEEGLKHLRQIFEVLRQGNLTLNLKKCAFLQTQVEYLGYEINEHGLKPSERKIACVRDFPTPQDVHDLRRFLGLASYFRRFVERFAVIASPLNSLLKKNATWKWENEEKEAFQKLKEKLISRPIIGLYNHHAITELHTDACQLGLAAILLQKGNDEKFHPISYASRATTSDEQKYHSYELETLAVVWSVGKFRTYLLGIEFTVITDCNSMRNTLAKRDLVPRIGRWFLKLQEYTYDIKHRPGTQMSHVDAMSRAPVDDPEETETTNGLDILTTEISFEDWLTTAQMQDEKLQRIKQQLETTENVTKDDKRVKEEFELIDGRIFKRINSPDGNESRVAWVCPTRARWQVVKQSHDDIGHFAVEKTLSRVQNTYWFPRMRSYIRRYIASCLECLYRKQPTGKQQGLLNPIDKTGGPFHTLHMDHLGPFVTSTQGNAHLIVAVDGYTKFTLLRAVRNTGMKPAAQFLEHIIGIFGAPFRVITDQGTTYTGHVFETVCKLAKIAHVKNATATPRGNGQVERYNRTLTPAIASLCERTDERDWDKNLKQVQWGLNNTIHSATKMTPFSLLFNYESRSPTGDVIEPAIRQVVDEAIAKRRQQAIDNVKKDQEQQRQRYNCKRIEAKTYKPGDLVVVKRDPVATGEPRKTVAKYRGPYVVTKRLKGDRYHIEDVPEMQRSQRFYSNVAPADKLKRWIVVNNEDESEDESSDEVPDPDENIDKLSDPKGTRNLVTIESTADQIPDDVPGNATQPHEVASHDTDGDNPRSSETSAEELSEAKRPQRLRRLPKHLADYCT